MPRHGLRLNKDCLHKPFFRPLSHILLCQNWVFFVVVRVLFERKLRSHSLIYLLCLTFNFIFLLNDLVVDDFRGGGQQASVHCTFVGGKSSFRFIQHFNPSNDVTTTTLASIIPVKTRVVFPSFLPSFLSSLLLTSSQPVRQALVCQCNILSPSERSLARAFGMARRISSCSCSYSSSFYYYSFVYS